MSGAETKISWNGVIQVIELLSEEFQQRDMKPEIPKGYFYSETGWKW